MIKTQNFKGVRRRPTNQYGFKIGSSKKAEELKTNGPRRKTNLTLERKNNQACINKENHHGLALK